MIFDYISINQICGDESVYDFHKPRFIGIGIKSFIDTIFNIPDFYYRRI